MDEALYTSYYHIQIILAYLLYIFNVFYSSQLAKNKPCHFHEH